MLIFTRLNCHKNIFPQAKNFHLNSSAEIKCVRSSISSAYQLTAIKNLLVNLLNLENVVEDKKVIFFQLRNIFVSSLKFSTSANKFRSPTNIIKLDSGMQKHSQINNRIFAPESACNTIEFRVFFAVRRQNLHMSPDIKTLSLRVDKKCQSCVSDFLFLVFVSISRGLMRNWNVGSQRLMFGFNWNEDSPTRANCFNFCSSCYCQLFRIWWPLVVVVLHNKSY